MLAQSEPPERKVLLATAAVGVDFGPFTPELAGVEECEGGALRICHAHVHKAHRKRGGLAIKAVIDYSTL